jgi:hypothetical protein
MLVGRRPVLPNSGRWVTALLCGELHIADDGKFVGSTSPFFSGTSRTMLLCLSRGSVTFLMAAVLGLLVVF